MQNNRRIIVFTIFVSLIAFLSLRIFYFQVLAGRKLARSASLQRMANAEMEKPRGNILDRNDIPLTNRGTKYSIVLQPLSLNENEEEFQKVCAMLELDYNKIKREFENKREPIIVETDKKKKERLAELKIRGVSIINSLKRYGENSVAKHALGYINRVDQVGETGIEKFYEAALKINRENTVSVITDARNKPLQGLGYRIIANQGKSLNVRLTLDYHIQKIVENVMSSNGIKGAVVVEDVASGDIVAMASKPDFDQNNVGRYLNSPNKELFNKAVAAYNLGSIFKIVDAAAMLTSNKFYAGDFFCEGTIKVGNKEFRCPSFEKGGHGKINFKEAFAYSCNTYFIHAGIELEQKSIINMARKFGMGSATGIKEQGVDESGGNLPISNYISDGDTANLAIGQGDVMVSPLQAADMVATIANGGIKNKINIVDSIVDGEGNKVRNIRKEKWERVISKDVADRIKSLMEDVTEYGTGIKAKLEGYGGAGGKTGSAETGQYINGEKVVHAWFVGYFPKRNPKYSMAVFIENGKNGGQEAAPIFAEIAKQIWVGDLLE